MRYLLDVERTRSLNELRNAESQMNIAHLQKNAATVPTTTVDFNRHGRNAEEKQEESGVS